MEKINLEIIINANLSKIWEHWSNPTSIQGWAFAADTWECPYAENDLRVGGRFLTRMSAKDRSEGFGFMGTYTNVVEHQSISYIMDTADGEKEHRECTVTFIDLGNGSTKVTEEFSPEETNSIEMQKAGWQAILENFKNYVVNH